MACGCEGINDFTIKQGAVFGPVANALAPSIYFQETVNNIPIDITGYTAQMVIRFPQDSEFVLVLSSEEVAPNSRLILNGPDGSVAPFFSEETTAEMELGTYCYQVFLFDEDGMKIFMAGGNINVAYTLPEEV